MAELPEVPTFNELGYPQMQANGIRLGMFLPAGAPKPVVDKIYRDVLAVISEPSFRAQSLPAITSLWAARRPSLRC